MEKNHRPADATDLTAVFLWSQFTAAAHIRTVKKKNQKTQFPGQ